MSKIKLYSCFLSLNEINIKLLFIHLRKQGIMDVELGLYDNSIYLIGFGTENIDIDKVNRIIEVGNKFLVDNNIKDVFWYDVTNNLSFANEVYLGNFILDNRFGSVMWAVDGKLPRDIRDYLSLFKDSVISDGKIIQRYEEDPVGGILTMKLINSKESDGCIDNIRIFFDENGYGPFSDFVWMNKFGMIVEDNKYQEKVLKKNK